MICKKKVPWSLLHIKRNLTFALIFFQLTHGASLAPEPHLFEPPYVGEIFKDLLLATHLLGISVNALLCKFFTQLISRKKNSNTIYLFFFQCLACIGGNDG